MSLSNSMLQLVNVFEGSNQAIKGDFSVLKQVFLENIKDCIASLKVTHTILPYASERAWSSDESLEWRKLLGCYGEIYEGLGGDLLAITGQWERSFQELNQRCESVSADKQKDSKANATSALSEISKIANTYDNTIKKLPVTMLPTNSDAKQTTTEPVVDGKEKLVALIVKKCSDFTKWLLVNRKGKQTFEKFSFKFLCGFREALQKHLAEQQIAAPSSASSLPSPTKS